MHSSHPLYGFTGCSGFKDFVAEAADTQREQCSAIVVVVHYEYFLFPIRHNMHGRIRDANRRKQISVTVNKRPAPLTIGLKKLLGTRRTYFTSRRGEFSGSLR
jgi:hypothetical protein